jgi:hypothetical protein
MYSVQFWFRTSWQGSINHLKPNGNYMCLLLHIRTLHLAHRMYLCVKWTVHTNNGTTCINIFTVKCPTAVPDISRQQTDRQSNVQFASTIRNWHCTLLVLNIQNVRHHATKCMWCVYNTRTLLYLQFTSLLSIRQIHVMSSSEVLTTIHICLESESTCLVQTQCIYK